MLKRIPLFLVTPFLAAIFLLNKFLIPQNKDFISPISSFESYFSYFESKKPFLKYSFLNLSRKNFLGGEIKLERILQEESFFTSWLFSFTYDGKKVTGMANIPKKEGKLPVVIMLRGYVDVGIYKTGIGTKKPANFFAKNGFITLAPDFLGYGDSDPEEKDILVNRFEKPVTVLNLLSSIKSLTQADVNNVFLWGHSNGGQIALSVLEISGKNIPTTLWAPVTRGFPESVLNYSAQLDDQGKMVAERIAEFEKEYDPKEFSITQYFEKIQAPIQVHLGEWDEYIKKEWVEEFVIKLKSLGKEVTFYSYPKNNHQLSKDWNIVVQRDLEFFRKNFKIPS